MLSDRALKDEFYGDAKPSLVKDTPEINDRAAVWAGYQRGQDIDLRPDNKVGASAPKELN